MTANVMMHNIMPDALSVQLRERAMVVAIVAALHFAVFTAWLMQPPAVSIAGREMEVAFKFAPAAVQAEQLQQQKTPVRTAAIKPPPEEMPEPAIMAPAPQTPEPVAQHSDVPAAAEPVASPAEVAPPEIEPDYKASYLNNRLTYPLAARRMGIQGRVVLNVEVLAAGMSGGIKIQESSGHTVLDRAALESVRNWRFVPASRAGQPFTKWFRVPIQFSLKDNEA